MDPISMYQNSEERLPSIQPSSSKKDPSLLRSERSVSLRKCRSEGVETYESYSQRRGMNREASSAAWAYTKYAMLFFVALLVTWVCFLPWARPARSMRVPVSCLTLVFVD
jgi:NADH:ubiquinone oxidoreductase subunit 3 (subunit A)